MKKILLFTLAFLVTISGFTFADIREDVTDEVVVTLPTFNVRINDQLIDSSKEQYPLIVFKGITYVPMTWNISHALGIDFQWNAQTGIKITKAQVADFLKLESNYNNLDASYKARICKEVVEVNGRLIDNNNEAYPLLTFRDITYFPMTYQFMVTDFGTDYAYNPEDGFSIAVDSKLSINYPESIYVRKNIMIDELYKNGGYIDDDIKIIPNKAQAMNLCISYKNYEMRDKMLNVKINFYDHDDQYVMTKDYIVGAMYHQHLQNEYGYGRNLIQERQIDYYNRAEIIMEFIEPEVAISQATKYKQDNNIEVELLTSDQITKEKFMSDGGRFLSPAKDICSNYKIHPDERYIQYAASFIEDGYYVSAANTRIVFQSEAEKTYLGASEYYWDIMNFTSFHFEDTDYRYNQFKGYYNDFVNAESYGQFIRLYDEDKKLIKIYVVTDQLGDNE